MLMPLLWIVLIGAVVWAVVRLIRPAAPPDPASRPATAREILDRRYAAGKIDEATYVRMRSQLDGTGPGSP
jgi:putative membrane protein